MVHRAGEVQITLLVDEAPVHWAERMDSQIQFRYESYGAGNDCVGANAANDDKYVSKLFNKPLKDWQAGERGYIDT